MTVFFHASPPSEMAGTSFARRFRCAGKRSCGVRMVPLLLFSQSLQQKRLHLVLAHAYGFERLSKAANGAKGLVFIDRRKSRAADRTVHQKHLRNFNCCYDSGLLWQRRNGWVMLCITAHVFRVICVECSSDRTDRPVPPRRPHPPGRRFRRRGQGPLNGTPQQPARPRAAAQGDSATPASPPLTGRSACR